MPAHVASALASGKHLLTNGAGNYYGVSAFYAGEQYNPFIMRDNNVSRNSGFNVNGSIYADFKRIGSCDLILALVTVCRVLAVLPLHFLSMEMQRKAVIM